MNDLDNALLKFIRAEEARVAEAVAGMSGYDSTNWRSASAISLRIQHRHGVSWDWRAAARGCGLDVTDAVRKRLLSSLDRLAAAGKAERVLGSAGGRLSAVRSTNPAPAAPESSAGRKRASGPRGATGDNGPSPVTREELDMLAKVVTTLIDQVASLTSIVVAVRAAVPVEMPAPLEPVTPQWHP